MRLDVANLVVLLHRVLDPGDGEFGNFGVDDARGEKLGVRVVHGELRILGRVRHGNDPSHGEPLVQGEQRLAVVLRSLAEVNLQRVRRRVRGSELAHAEGGGHVRGEEAGAHRDGFIGVEVKVQSSAVESLGEGLLDAGNARAAADGLDDLDVLQCDVKVREGLHDGLEGTRGAGEDPLLLRERLEILPRNRGPKVDILVHALDGQRRLLVGAEDLLGLANLLAELGDRLGRVKRRHRGLMLGVKLGEKVVHEEHVHVLASHGLVPLDSLDLELAVLLLLTGVLALERGVAHEGGARGGGPEVVDDGPRALLVEILVDSPLERGARKVGHLGEDVQPRHVGGVVEGVPVGLAEVRGDGDDGILGENRGKSGGNRGVRVASSLRLFWREKRGKTERFAVSGKRGHGRGPPSVRDDRRLDRSFWAPVSP